jgi:RHS repeat-associated protein
MHEFSRGRRSFVKAQGWIRGFVSLVLVLTIQLQAQASILETSFFQLQKPEMVPWSNVALLAGHPALLSGVDHIIRSAPGSWSKSASAENQNLLAQLRLPHRHSTAITHLQIQQSLSIPKQSQSVTLLPDGQTLLLGGFDADRKPVSEACLVDRSGNKQTLPAHLQVARAGHTATVLPDGTVLVFGGVNDSGEIVSQAELYDPIGQTFSAFPSRLVPRAFHSATLLTDGTLLVAGGVEANHSFPTGVQLWHYRRDQAVSFDRVMAVPRQGHTAILLSDGSVRISGGTDMFSRPVTVDEIYDPAVNRSFSIAPNQSSVEDQRPSRLAASIPADGATGISTRSILAFRFTTPLEVTSVASASFVLAGPDGASVAAKVVAAEQGRLVFVLPDNALQAGTTYILRIQAATDIHRDTVVETSISFTTEGEAAASSGEGSSANGATTSQWQDLPPLQAVPGETAVSGQVLKLNGWPLERVTLQMGKRRAQTDATGRFLLKGLSSGHQVLVIDARTASRPDAAYGRYEVGVTVLPNKTNALNYTIWMTPLDMTHAASIPSPTTTETVITNPALPGLELHLPPNTVITDDEGKTVRQISITPIPLKQPPFPLPAGVKVPIYFTIQPGGAYIKVLHAGNGPKGARLIYPNTFNFKPGTLFNFWNYDAEVKGWFVYGSGKVSPDGVNVIPDPSVVLYQFTGAMVGSPGVAPPVGPPAGTPRPKDGDPVDLSTGQFIYSATDVTLPDVIPIHLTRTYITNDSLSRAFGIGATHSYDIFMVGDTFPYTYQEMVLPEGSRIRFDRISPGTSWSDAIYISTSPDPLFYGATLRFNPNDTWIVTRKDGTEYVFPDSFGQARSQCQAVIQILDRHGNKTKLDRSGCNLMQVTSPNGRYIQFQYDSSNRVISAMDNIGRTVSYTYDPVGRLATVTDLNGGVTTYTYNDQNEMATITDPRGITYLSNQYDANGRVVQQTQADGSTYLFSWTLTGNAEQAHFYQDGAATTGTLISQTNCWNGNSFNRLDPTCTEGYLPLVQQVDVTDPRGYSRRVQFGPTGYETSDTHALGQPEQQTVTYSYYADNTLKSVTDALGRTASYNYDGLGNITTITRLDGTPNPATATFTYEPAFQGLATATDPLGHTSTLSYDASGNITSIAGPLHHQTTLAYNAAGQVTAVTDALNNSIQFGYFGGDLVSLTDPLGNTTRRFVDSAGRVTSTTDAQGDTTQFQYNGFNLLNSLTDPQGNTTIYNYDANGNLLSLLDPLQHATAYTYDNLGRKTSKTDALSRAETYTYDANGNLSSHTDRAGQTTTFTYDGLNRRIGAGFGLTVNSGTSSYQSTITYTLDGADRMTQVSDSISGTITRSYDGLDNLLSETTPQGGVAYSYDLAGRRTSMTVAGQPAVSYSYDDDGRLTKIGQANSNVTFTYDDANRRSSLELPNGMEVSYTYDQDSNLTNIGFAGASGMIGNLSYTYDSLGRRTQVAGSLASTALPSPIASAGYDAANQLTNWNGMPVSFDANGSMLSDGVNTFAWDARNQLSSVNGVNLVYDAFGRRIQNLQGTSFLYDGVNPVQELSGTTVTANLLTGAIDEIFSRTDASGSFTQLRDALGSTIALADGNGAIAASYTYDPYGATLIAGQGGSNLFQFTGRENEGNGLYAHRARYYSATFQRFLSLDPKGYLWDTNPYVYARNNPLTFVDPLGLDPQKPPDPPNKPPCDPNKLGALKTGLLIAGLTVAVALVGFAIVPLAVATTLIAAGGIAIGAFTALQSAQSFLGDYPNGCTP